MRISYVFFGLLGLLASGCAPTAPCRNYNEYVDRQYVHLYGVTMPQHEWEMNQNGQIVTTLKDGVTCSQSYYGGVLEGETTYTFPYSSNTEKVHVYSQNQLLKETLFYPAGTPREETVYVSPENVSITKQWYENGILKSEEKLSGNQVVYGEYFDSQGHRTSGIEQGNGLRMGRNTYGVLEYTDEYKEGEVQYHTAYYSDGTPKEIDPYIKGVLQGKRRTFYQSGEPKTIETWNEGRQEGITIVFQDGQKAQEIPYVNGRKNGIGKVFKDGEIVVQEITWKEDKMHGPCYTYIDNRVATEWYFHGRKVTKGYYDSFSLKPSSLASGS